MAFISIPARAEVQVFAVNSAISSLTLQGTTGGAAWQPQGEGGLTTGVSGWLAVDVGPDSIQFLAGSVVTGTQTNPWRPGAGSSVAAEPADFGGEVATGSGISAGRDLLAVRHLRLLLTSDPIAVANRLFDASALRMDLPAVGQPGVDYLATGLVVLRGQHLLGGLGATNAAAGGSLVKPLLPDVGTSLTVPVDLTLPAFALAGGDTRLHLTGSIVGGRGGNIIAQPVLLQAPSPLIPGSFTLFWDSNFHLQRATDLAAGDWSDYAASAPFDVPLDDGAAFYRVVN
jgi:hypothetical protein